MIFIAYNFCFYAVNILCLFQEKKENDKLIPYFVIRVHLANDAEVVSSQMVGWIVTRSLSSFHSLHQKLVPVSVFNIVLTFFLRETINSISI